MVQTKMEIINLKKGMMRAAKRWLMLALIVGGCTSTGFLKKIQKKTFYYGYNTGFSSTAYRFQDHTFKTKTFIDFEGVHEISGGTYRIAGDTLVLNFKPRYDPDPSTFKFVKRVPVTSDDNKAKTLGFVRFKIVDHEGRPVTEGVNLNLRDNSHEIIKSLQPDSLGTFRVLPLRKQITDFMVSPLARKPVIIPTDTLNGYNAKVKVILSDSATSYNKFNGIKKYLIKKANKDKIILKSMENDKRIVLKRVNSK